MSKLYRYGRVVAVVGLFVAVALVVPQISRAACETDSDCAQQTGLPASTCLISGNSSQCSIPSIGYTCINNACVSGYNNGPSYASCVASCHAASGATASGQAADTANQDSVNSCTTPPTRNGNGLWSCSYCFPNGALGVQCRPIYPCGLNGGCVNGPNSGAIGSEFETAAAAQAAGQRDGCTGVQRIDLGVGLARPNGLNYYFVATGCPGQSTNAGGGANGGGGTTNNGGTGTGTGGSSIGTYLQSIQSSILQYRNANPLTLPGNAQGNAVASTGGSATQSLLASLTQSLLGIQAALATSQGSLTEAVRTSVTAVLSSMAQIIQSLQGQTGGAAGTNSSAGRATLLVNGAASGAFSVGQTWTLTLSSNVNSAPVNLCAQHPDGTRDCTPAAQLGANAGALNGSTNTSGGWTLSNVFGVGDVGSWDEWICFGSVSACNAGSASTVSSSHAIFSVSPLAVVAVRPNPSCTFSANPSTISSGATSTLAWNCTNVLSCAIGIPVGNSVAYPSTLAYLVPHVIGSTSAGNGTVALTATTQFVLHCTNASPLDIYPTSTVTVSSR